MAAALRFSTDGMRHSDRLPFWNAGSVAIGGVEAEALADCPFSGTVIRRTLGAATVFDMTTTPHRAAWTMRLIRRASAELPLRLCFQQRGRTVLLGDGAEHVVGPGEWFLADGRRPYVSLHPEPSRKIALQVAIDRFDKAERDAIRRMAGGFPIDGGIARMLEACLDTALLDETLRDERLDSDLGETMIDFFRLMIREKQAAVSPASMRELTQDRIRSYVRRNLRNPDLSVEMIAQAMKCSKRYIHKLFRGEQTISEYIWALRLDQCRAILSEPGAGDITLTQLAFDNGFSSSAHFSRAFRDRFGIPPRMFRAERQDASSPADKIAARERTSQPT
jgi:AraC-like DNA-binding protein